VLVAEITVTSLPRVAARTRRAAGFDARRDANGAQVHVSTAIEIYADACWP
jgi:hypothetical protein